MNVSDLTANWLPIALIMVFSEVGGGLRLSWRVLGGLRTIDGPMTLIDKVIYRITLLHNLRSETFELAVFGAPKKIPTLKDYVLVSCSI